jgi:superfamily I DNA/RNA helicase
VAAPAEVTGTPGAGNGWVTRVERVWVLSPFRKQMLKRSRETGLLDQLDDCVDQLFRDPRSPGLNLETLRNAGKRPVMSARIARGPRVILTPLGKQEIGLLYFDQHEEAYRWVDRNGANIGKMLERAGEVVREAGVRSALAAIPGADGEDEPLLLRSAEEFRKIVQDGVERYLTWLDDDQRTLVDLRARGLLLIKGGAGTGKTAVAIHRLLKTARQPVLIGPRKVLYLCFNSVLAKAVQELVAGLSGRQVPEDVEIRTFHRWGRELLERVRGSSVEIDEEQCRRQVAIAFGKVAMEQRRALAGVDGRYVDEEIKQVIKNNGFTRREEYLQVNRRGRRMSLKEPARAAIWEVFERAEAACRARGIVRFCDLPLLALQVLEERLATAATGSAGAEEHDEGMQYRAVIIDEGQDCSPVMVRLARRLLAATNGPLTVFADPAQAIYECGFQWTQAELRPKGGDTHILRKNYRTTREIFRLAQGLRDGSEDEEMEEAEEPNRKGERPVLLVEESEASLRERMVERVVEKVKVWPANLVGVLAASWSPLEQLERALLAAGVPAKCMNGMHGPVTIGEAGVKLLTTKSVKGLDFPVVFLWGPHLQDMGGWRRRELPETRREVYVALTRAGAELTIGIVHGQQHSLVENLDMECCELAGSRAGEVKRGQWKVMASTEEEEWWPTEPPGEAELTPIPFP